MNRFNLSFVFLSTLISSALNYSIDEGEKIEMEVKELIHFRKDLFSDPKPQKATIVEQEIIFDMEAEIKVK